MDWHIWKTKIKQEIVDDDKQVALTPTTINKENDKKQYGSVLNLARKLEEPDVLNIALTGPYGSGKSTILRSLKKDFKAYNYLSISLATLKSAIDEPDGEMSNEDIEIQNNRIEYSILQQLEYQEKQETLYNSRFKRIYHKSNKKQYGLAIAIILYIVALIIVFEPSFVKVDWICQLLNNPLLNKWADTISILYLIGATIKFAQKAIKSLSNSKLNKLNLVEGEIEIEKETSVFNKHMDEIIYFFQVTKYNVVIIEDLDRFNNTEIFLKLREVNQLLNQSKSVGRKIVFIYAVRDDMFLDEERTKFFDYITTVIPIINSSNSADKLKEELENKGLDGIRNEVIESLAFFIDDMRLLKNIVNEYAQYREKLDDKLDQNKLLAMIVYKNYFPKDFADLHKGTGTLYACLHKKQELLLARNKQIDEKIEEINNKLRCNAVSNALQEKELRLIYIEAYNKYLRRQGINYLLDYQIDNNLYNVEDIAENETLFNSFIAQKNIRYRLYSQNSYNRVQSGYMEISFSQIEKNVNSNFTYAERIEAIRTGEKELKEQIKELEMSRSNHYVIPLQVLIANIDLQKHEVFKGIEIPKMLESFLKDGLIDEDYFDYISFFFGKSINRHDHEFILELKLKHSLPYNYPIDKVEQCVKNIPEKCYHEVNILNIQIIDYICQHLNDKENETRLHAIIRIIKNRKKWDFLIDFYKAVENPQPLFVYLANEVTELWKVIVKLESDELYEAWLRFVELEHSTKDSRSWIENHYGFISQRAEKIGINTITQIVSGGDIVFLEIDSKSETLLEYVVQNKAYILTPSNVACAFVYCRKERIETYVDYPLNITLINTCETAQPVAEYIDEYIDDVLNDIFVTIAAKQESAEVIASIVNSDKIDDKNKRKYLSGQQNKISLSSIDKSHWNLAIETDIVLPSWSDIYLFYISRESLMEANLQRFISAHIEDLTDISDLNECYKKTLGKSLLLTSDFELHIYDKLINILGDVTFIDEDISNIDDAHLCRLIKGNKLPYSAYYIESIRDYHSESLTTYVDKYIEECISEIQYLPKSMPMCLHLLHNKRVEGDFALKVVLYYLPYMEWNSEMANLVLPIMKKHIDKFDYETEKVVLEHSTTQQEKQELLLASVNKNRANMNRISELLYSTGEPYRTITDKNKKAALSNVQINKSILNKLEEIGYISSYSENENKLRVNHKRK